MPSVAAVASVTIVLLALYLYLRMEAFMELGNR